MTDWTKEREGEALARCDAAPKGPWETDGSIYDEIDRAVVGPYAKGADGRQTIALIAGGLEDENGRKIRDHDIADFIAHARIDLPDAIRNGGRLREELREVWTHTPLKCPCAVRQFRGDIEDPAPWQDCTCGLNEALYG